MLLSKQLFPSYRFFISPHLLIFTDTLDGEKLPLKKSSINQINLLSKVGGNLGYLIGKIGAFDTWIRIVFTVTQCHLTLSVHKDQLHRSYAPSPLNGSLITRVGFPKYPNLHYLRLYGNSFSCNQIRSLNEKPQCFHCHYLWLIA